MTVSESTKLSALESQLNRLKAKRVALEREQIAATKQERKRRTRTKIQLGGLLEMVGLTERFDIVMGDDLQLNQEDQDKSATLLGLLVSLIEQLPPNLDKVALKNKGILFLKMRSAAKHY